MGEENTNDKTNKDVLLERMRVKYPEKNFEDDEELYGSINDDYDNYDNDMAGYKEREQGLIDMFEADPRSANFLTNWRKGSDPVIELARLFGPELKEALDDPDKLDALAEAHKEYLDKVEQEKVQEQEYKDNLANSLQTINELQESEGISDDEVEQAMELLVGIARDAGQGIYTPETLQMAFNALNHDKDVATAEQEAEVRGRNSKIQERLRTPEGDGVAQLASSNAAPNNNKKPQSIFDIAAGAQ